MINQVGLRMGSLIKSDKGLGDARDYLSRLIPRCLRGDSSAFTEVVAHTQTKIYNLAYGVLHNHEEAQDAAQEIYLRVWCGLANFRGEAQFTTWLYRIAVNTCLNRLRHLRPQRNRLDSEDPLDGMAAPDSDPAALTIHKERRESLWEAVERLPTKYRLVITLFYQRQLSYQEIAEKLSLPPGTVKGHLNRARRALAKILDGMREYEDIRLRIGPERATSIPGI